MKIRDLLTELYKYPEDMEIGIAKEDMRMGSSWTGPYCIGTRFVEISSVRFVNGDALGSLTEPEEQDHLELCTDDYE